MLIFLLASLTLGVYQVMAEEDRLDETTRAADQLDARVKHAEYEKAKLFAIARDLLLAAPKDPNAEKIVTELKLRKLQAAEPDLMAPSPTPVDPSSPQAGANTNNVVEPSEGTNATPMPLPAAPPQ